MKDYFSAYRYELLHRFDPYQDYLKQALRVGIASFLGILVYRYFQAVSSQSYWALMVVTFLSRTRVGASSREQVLSVAVCGVISCVLGFIAIYAAENILTVALLLGLVGVGIAAFRNINEFSAQRSVPTSMLAIISAGVPLEGGTSLERVIFMALGVLFTFGTSLLWIKTPNARFRLVYVRYLHAITEFVYQEIYLNLQELDRAFLNERLHERRNRLLRQLKECRTVVANNKKNNHAQAMILAEELYLLTVSFGDLRFLYADKKDELKKIYNKAYHEMAAIFQEKLSYKTEPSTPDDNIQDQAMDKILLFYVTRLKAALNLGYDYVAKHSV